MVHKFLFYIENGNITVIRYIEAKSEKKLEFLPKEGSRNFPIEEDFWEWWMDAVGYSCKKEDQVDFCFLYDNKCSLIQHDFPEVEKSVWNQEKIEVFLKKLIPSEKVQLYDEERRELEINPGYFRQEPKILHTNVSLNPKLGKGGDSRSGDDEEEMTDFSKYFTELLYEKYGK